MPVIAAPRHHLPPAHPDGDNPAAVPSRRVMIHEREVPFSSSLCWRCHVNNLNLSEMVKASRQYEQNYLAWETVRRGGNPFFKKGTGFEGYLVGTCRTPEEALHDLIAIGQDILDSIVLRYRLEYGFKNTLMRTLSGECCDPRAIEIWSVQLGVILGRLRCRAAQNPQATVFRIHTYHAVSLLPPIIYRKNGHSLSQTYFVDPFHVDKGVQMPIRTDLLKPSEQMPWRVLESIGQFGHPLVREMQHQLESIHTFLAAA